MSGKIKGKALEALILLGFQRLNPNKNECKNIE